MLRCTEEEGKWPSGSAHDIFGETVLVWVRGMTLFYVEKENIDIISVKADEENYDGSLFTLIRGKIHFECEKSTSQISRRAASDHPSGYAIVVKYDDMATTGGGASHPPSRLLSLQSAKNQAKLILEGEQSYVKGKGIYRELAEAAAASIAGGNFDNLAEIKEWAKSGGFPVTRLDLNGEDRPSLRPTGTAMSCNIKLAGEKMEDWASKHNDMEKPFEAIVKQLWEDFQGILKKLYEVQLIVSEKSTATDGQALHWDSVSDQMIVVIHLNRGLATFVKKGKPRRLEEVAKEARMAVLGEEEEAVSEASLGSLAEVLKEAKDTDAASALLDTAVSLFEGRRRGRAVCETDTRMAVEFFKRSMAAAGIPEGMLEKVAGGDGSWLWEYKVLKETGFSDPKAVMEVGDFCMLPTMWPHCGPGSGKRTWPLKEGSKKESEGARAVLYMRFDIDGRATSELRNHTDTTWSMKTVAQWVRKNGGTGGEGRALVNGWS